MSWSSSEEPLSFVRLLWIDYFFGVVFGEWEGTLSVNSRDLNESSNMEGFFLSQTVMRHKALFRSRAPMWCRPKTLRRENKYPCLKKAENTCELCVCGNQKLCPFDRDEGVLISV